MPVAELLDRTTGEELTDWEAYERLIGPLGPTRGDWQAAMIASTVANSARGKKGKAAKLKDFLLKWKTSSSGGGQSAEELERAAKMIASRVGGTWTQGGGER